jgi:hypothetical protein
MGHAGGMRRDLPRRSPCACGVEQPSDVVECLQPQKNAVKVEAGQTEDESCKRVFVLKTTGLHLSARPGLASWLDLNSDIEISRKDAKARRMKGKKNMLLQKFSKHFTNSVNSPLQKFLKTTLRLCDFA